MSELTPEEAATVERFEHAPDALTEDLRDEVAEVLIAHEVTESGCTCGGDCGWTYGDWIAHLADALLPLIAQREAAARTEGAARVIAYPEQVLAAARAEERERADRDHAEQVRMAMEDTRERVAREIEAGLLTSPDARRQAVTEGPYLSRLKAAHLAARIARGDA